MQPFDLFLFVFIYLVGAAVLFFLSRLLRQAGEAAGELKVANRLIAGLWLWPAVATVYALITGTDILWFAVSFVIPFAIGFALTFTGPVSRILQKMSIAGLVGLQIYRNAGAIFLVAYILGENGLSREFAMNAGWGDILTGMLAIPVAVAAYARYPFWRIALVVWTLIGAGDLILAPLTAFLYGGPGVDDFPMNMIPIFLGPPLGILLHAVTLRALWLQHGIKAQPDARPALV